jgi:hypothetical protein
LPDNEDSRGEIHKRVNWVVNWEGNQLIFTNKPLPPNEKPILAPES